MKRLFNITCSLIAFILLSLVMLFVALLVRLTSPGPIQYWSDRVGRNNQIFKMPKFRTMRTDTPAVATHLLDNPDQWLTPVGKFLRKSNLDELPQLFRILNGSLIYVSNLVDALAVCAVHPAAAGQSYLVSDGEDVSTPELIRETAAALGTPARLFSVPVSLMRLAGKVLDFGFLILNLKSNCRFWILDCLDLTQRIITPFKIQNPKFKIDDSPVR